jgi:hypothetical protein
MIYWRAMNNIKVKPMEMSMINCAGFGGSDLAENGYSMELELWKMIRWFMPGGRIT